MSDLQYRPTVPADMLRDQGDPDDLPPRHPVAFLSGPMRGLPSMGFPAFLRAAEDLRGRGIGVVSPAEHDLAQGFDPDDPNALDDFDLPAAMQWDLEQVRECDLLILLPGWESSEGARGELREARRLDKRVFLYCGAGVALKDLPATPSRESPLESATPPLEAPAPPFEARVTDPQTGGQKDRKLAQLGALDPLALGKLAEVAGYGASKYDRHNYLRGYAWSLSYDALQRHLLAFWAGENFDPESGLPHLAHATFHCLALTSFLLRDLGTDDRYKG